ncbi:MAG: PQQ-dependent sugar dehydrogenase [Chloroflexi bacterium]|nr:PQQ-dependent sugar dehydrogenase [Chloroflexota bacterium]
MLRRVRVVLLIATVVAIGFVGVQPAAAVTVDETDFTRGIVAGAGFTTALPTALTIGPDGRLFVADQEGRIQALTLDPKTKAVTAVEEITTNADLQEVFGIAFDPTDASSPPPVYVTNTVSGFGSDGPAPAGAFPGKVTKIHGAGYSTITDIITGLSTSDSAHQANGIVFAADGTLYIAHGSTTNAGVNVPAGPLFTRPDVPLSGAILVASPNAFVFDGNVTYDPPGTYSSTVNLATGDVFVFASGLRNPYDLIIHSNGKIYATDNGPNSGFGGSSTSCTTEDPDPWAPDTRGPDELNLIEAGNYYGQPNRNRARFDARQCVYHNGLDGSGVDWTGPIDLLPVSSNGLAEYTSAAFGGKLAGDLFYVSFNDGLLGHVVLSPDGTSVVSNNTTFASSFVTPLDIAVDSDGTLYIAEIFGNRITFMQPKPVPVGGVSLDGGLRALSDGSSGSLWLIGWLLAVAAAVFAATLGGAAWRQRSGQR